MVQSCKLTPKKQMERPDYHHLILRGSKLKDIHYALFRVSAHICILYYIG